MQKADTDIEIVLIGVTEQPIERPKKGQKKWYSGKKKCHTIKTLIFANAADNTVITIAGHKGSTHDFNILKENFEWSSDKIKFLTDSDFQGILEFHANSETPIKSSKNHKLTAGEKAYNHKLSKCRIFIEHINGWIKRFKILSYKYRNKRLRHGLMVTLICGIYNAMRG